MPSQLVKRSDGAQFAERITLLSPRRRTTLLAGTAFTGAFVAAMMGSPQRALAACAGDPGPLVTCDFTNPSGGTLSTTFGGTTVVNDNAGGNINTGGATVVVTAAGSLTFNNNDTTFGIRNNALNGVDLTNNFGAITYVGNANVTATNVAVSGINVSAGAAGDVSITNNATVTGGAYGIIVSHAGTGAVLVTGTGTATGGTFGIWAQNTGLGPAAGANGIVITGSGNAASSGGTGIFGFISNAAKASNILIDRAGTVSGDAGIAAETFGTGNITVTGASLVTSTAGTGIDAVQQNNVAGTKGSVTVGGTGNVNAVGIGIDAEVGQPNNTGSVVVNRTGTVTSTGTGIFARALGGGDVTVTGVGNVSAAGNNGIQAAAFGNGNVVVAPAGTVFGFFSGIDASAQGSGNVTVTTSQDVTGPQGGGIVANVVDGRITVTVTAGTVKSISPGFLVAGITATASGTGGATITVNAGASVIAEQFTGMVVTGTNNIITNNGTIRGAGGIQASGPTTIVNAGAITGPSEQP